MTKRFETEEKNLVLIGMPGAGKSTIGVILAKYLSLDFIDSDVYIQAQKGKTLQEIINIDGLEYFCALEEEYILTLSCTSSVIATGGSVIYSDKAMRHLKSNGIIIYLYLPFTILEKRLSNFCSRGVVIKEGQRLSDLYNEREPLYRRYGDIIVNCTNLIHEDVIEAIITKNLFNRDLTKRGVV
ncbi:MAG: shikimate kinase [bacterium]